jgi:hypothetical protein
MIDGEKSIKDIKIGRFVSEDPIGFAAGDPNIYRYVGNSPTNFVDPFGLECQCSSTTSNIDYGTVAAEGAKSAAIGLATVAGVGLAVGAGVISAPAVAVIGGALLLYSAGSSLFRRSEQARISGNNSLSEIAGATALDTFGFGGLAEGIRGRELVTGRCLNTDERSRGIGQGIGNALTLVAGAKVFCSASSYAEGKAFSQSNNFLNPEEFAQLSNGGKIDPNRIRFSQDSINNRFKPPYENQTLKDFTALIKEGTIKTEPIRIVEKDGKIFALDNRRLYSYQQAGLEINYNKLSSVPKRQLFKFTTQNDGVSVTVRNK